MKKIQILGPGCWKCEASRKNAEAAAKEFGIEYELEKVTKINDIMKLGVMVTPALVVDGQVKVAGGLPSVEQLKEMLK